MSNECPAVSVLLKPTGVTGPPEEKWMKTWNKAFPNLFFWEKIDTLGRYYIKTLAAKLQNAVISTFLILDQKSF